MQRIVSTLFFFLLLAGVVQAGSFGKWKTYTSKREVRDVIVVDSVIWAATSGGLFSYSLLDHSLEQFTSSDGLHAIDLTALASDSAGNIWIGASNGIIHRFKPHFHTWDYVSGLDSVQNEPSKRINGFRVLGDTLIILSDVGVSMFSISRMEFGDTYRRFGSANQLAGKVNDIEFFQNKIFVATSNGIASTPGSNTNPAEPGSWVVVNSGLPSPLVHKLILFHDSLYAATDLGIASFHASAWQTIPSTLGKLIADFSLEFGNGTTPTALYFCAGNELWKYNGGTIELVASGFGSSLTSLTGNAVAGTSGNGAVFEPTPFTHPSGAAWNIIIPEGPGYNTFAGIAVDDRGVLWSGTGTASGSGFMSFDGVTWKNYLPDTATHTDKARYAYIIDIGTDNSKWISTFGQGVVHMNGNNVIDRAFNTASELSYTLTASNDPTFIVTTGVSTDQNGDAWINVRSAANRNLLAIFSPRTQSFRYVNYPTGYQLPILMHIIEDTYGTKWFTALSIPGNSPPGLVFYDQTLRLPRRLYNSTGWGVITEDDGLSDNQVNAVAIDLDGSLWVGTNQGGLNFIVDPTVPYRILPYHLLAGQKINDILVDPLNQKWVATEQGVYLVSPDGTSVLDQFTVHTTDGQLPNDHVSSIAMNRQTGVIYFATETAMATLSTVAVAPRAAFEDLKIYPNPFFLPASSPVTIDGLVENSTIKILSTSGNLMKEVSTPGGRVGFWDGRDEQGNFVPSGIYIVTAYSKDGNSVGKGKVAVLRK